MIFEAMWDGGYVIWVDLGAPQAAVASCAWSSHEVLNLEEGSVPADLWRYQKYTVYLCHKALCAV